MIRSVSLIVCAFLLAGCQPTERDAGDLTERRDSAGVTIVETPGPIWGEAPRWTASPEPLVSIGALEGDPEYLLSRVFTAAMLSDGGIVVADGGTSTLRWYDSTGTFLFQRGGSGEGPGEFGRIGRVGGTAGDTLVITDSSLRRITEFTATGDLLSTHLIEGIVVPGGAERLSDGTFIIGTGGFSSSQWTGEEEGFDRAIAPLLRVGLGLERPDTVGMFPGPEMYFTARSFGSHPFSRGFNYAVRGHLLFVATAEGFVVDVHSPDGELVRSIRAPEVDLPLTPEDIGEYKRGVREAAADLDEANLEATVEWLDALTFPGSRPAYGRFVAGDDALWLEEHTAGQVDGPGNWAVFAHDGEYRGIATLPAGFRLLGVWGDRVLGVWTDDLGVEYVRVYGLVEADE